MHGKKEGGERPLLFYGLLTSQGFGAHPYKRVRCGYIKLYVPGGGIRGMRRHEGGGGTPSFFLCPEGAS